MIDRDLLLDDLKSLTADLVDDLRDRTDEVDEIHFSVHRQYDEARDAGRTDQSFEEWREDLLAQVAVGWVLATVFVRFCEDNDLYGTPLLSGPGQRRDLAGDRRADWLADHPEAGDREWLQEVFRRYQDIPAIAELFGEKNPLWQFGPSADGAKAIIELWQRIDTESGKLRHDFTDPDLDTRFLGDLYQDLSEHAKKKYALLQTPEFVEEFILDRTLDPAIETFGLEEVRMIDPACGSGHFLLGAFDRILELWREREPGTPIRKLVQRTLNAVNGVDLNPYAVEIARFRLLEAALKASDIDALRDAPVFKLNVAVGDSLIHGRRSGELFTGAEVFGEVLEHRYPTEDEELANSLLESGRYHAVVGNPPYITVKEPALRDVYRTLYDTAYRQYSLALPFTERMFDLTRSAKHDDAGYVGIITTNSFMKRLFGKLFVEDWLPRRYLTHIVDTSGAYIPGHGTPTVILFGRNQKPSSPDVRAVLGIRGEPGRPSTPAEGEVWQSIVDLIDRPGAENEYVSCEDAPRERYASHPWSLQGGAAPKVLDQVENTAVATLQEYCEVVGFGGITGNDNAFVYPDLNTIERRCIEQSRTLVIGEDVRDWNISESNLALWPYDQDYGVRPLEEIQAIRRALWPFRRNLQRRKRFGTPVEELELPWYAWRELYEERLKTPLSLTFAFVATHNHFVLDGGGKVFNRSAPIIKLPKDATEEDHLELLGLLNSSTACFWMKQVFHSKGEGGGARVAAGYSAMGDEAWKSHYELDGTKLKKFPIPSEAPLERAHRLDQLAERLTDTLPSSVLEDAPPTEDRLQPAREQAEDLRARMVALQEELDWECYQLYGLTEEELTAPKDRVPKLKKGQRAFEIVLARQMAAGDTESTWFERHDSTPITELPDHWPEPYRRIVERRIDLIESDRAIRLLEKPEHKRRWNWDSWGDLQEEALEKWLLDRLEAEEFWADPELMTTARLTDRVLKDEEFVEAARLYAGRVDVDLTELVTSLVEEESVPFAVCYRFNASGMRRRREWEEVWELQREEDAIDARTELPADDPEHLTEAEAEDLKEERGLDDIPVPPKYRKKDYADNTAYYLRGNLDVPQERFITYPDTRKGADTTPVIGWAGWDHLERAQALASHYTARKEQGAAEGELVPLLAGLQELVPWLRQWHNEMDLHYSQRMGEFFASFIADEAKILDRTVEELKTWTPD